VTNHRAPVETPSPRMGRLARLPIFVALEDKRAIIAGGGAAAAWKAELLSAAGALVDVYAETPGDDLVAVSADPPHGAVVLHRRAWAESDLARASVAVGAFETDDDAAAFTCAARNAGVPVNVIDKPAFCDFSFGSIVNRSPLVIGISTDGAAPVFAQAVRAKIEALLPKGFARWAQAAARWRAVVKQSGLPFAGRRTFWQLFASFALRHPNADPTDDNFATLLEQVRNQGAAVENGSVTLVGAGPGDAELLTLRAVRALQSADVILFDDLVSRDVLDFARREARKLQVGKTGYGPSCKQDDINALIVGLAKQGKRVVRLKGGDPLIFARADEEIAACQDAGIALDVVPGITAAQGAASRLQVPLTGRGHARRLQYITGHSRDGALPDDIDWRALADPATTTVIYMPVKTLSELIGNAIEQGLDPQTPAAAIARATLSDEAVVAGAVGILFARLAEQPLPGPLLVIIGHTLAQIDQLKPAQTKQSVFA